MQRKEIHLTSSIIEAVGIKIFEKSNPRIVWKFVISFSVYLTMDLFLGIFLLTTDTDDFHRFITPIPYIAGTVIVQSGSYFIFHHRKVVSVLLHQMDRDFYVYPDEILLQIEYPWYLREHNIIALVTATKYASLSILFVICIPVLGEIIYYGKIKTFIYPIWTPFDMDNLGIQLVITAIQFLQGFSGLWFNYINMVFLFIVVTEFVRQYKRLIAVVSSLESRTLENSVKGRCFEDTLGENIIHCIRHHQALYENFKRFKVWFSIFFSIELAISAFTFTFAIYVAMNLQASSLTQIMNYFPVVFFVWITILIRCLICEIFPQLNASLAECILWDTPWYKVNKQNSRLLMMFHSAAVCNPLRLYGLSVFGATRATFGRLVRITYSFYNVLKRENQ